MHCHSAWSQVLVPSAVLAASLLGSGHCALMCGGLVMTAARSPAQQISYHLGRLFGYIALGAVSGWLGGNAILHLPRGFSEGVALAVGVSFVFLGIAGWKGGWHFAIPGFAALNNHVIQSFRGLTNASQSGRSGYAALIGLLSIFLPCGWLYGFVLAALSIADPLKGALMMIIFWSGTLPALILSPLILRKVFSVTGTFAPKLASILLIASGILPIFFRYVKF